MSGAAMSAVEARRLILTTQGVLGASTRPRNTLGVLQRLAALQLDTISVLARSHELVCFARIGPLGRGVVDASLHGVDAEGWPRSVEYWAHAACILPTALWPWLAVRRRRFRASNRWSLTARNDVLDHVRRQLEADGPLTATQLGGAKNGGPWWDWSPVKVAVEVLLDWGEVVCVMRRGWKRVYDLAERALPPQVLGPDPDDEECLAHLVATAGAALGVATRRDLADYFRLRAADVAAALPSSGLVPVDVEGWPEPAWADPAALARPVTRGHHRTTLLSPFDSLVWDRARTQRVFGFTHRLEAYTPAAKRVHGYYAMPILAGGRLIGRVDPGREGRTLVAKQVGLVGPSSVAPAAAALVEAAAWVGADSVALGRVDPPALAPALQAALP